MTEERRNSDSNEELDKDTEELLNEHEENIEKLTGQINKELLGIENIMYNSLFREVDERNRNIHVIDPYNVLLFICGTHFSFLVYSNFYTILKCLYVMILISGGLGIGFVVTAYSMNNKYLKEEIPEEYSQEMKYDMFLNNEYEEFKEIFNDEEMKKNEYENNNEEFLKKLTDVSYHFEKEIPLEYNNKVIMYYNHDEEAYHYYAKSGDINYKILNSLCRSYVLENKCINLFNDDEEISYIKDLIKKEKENEEQEKNSYEDLSELNNEEEENSQQEDEEEEKEEKRGLFYFGSSKKQEKNKKVIENRINKFIHKGNLIDYENKYNKKKNGEKKEIDYNEFKKLMDKVQN